MMIIHIWLFFTVTLGVVRLWVSYVIARDYKANGALALLTFVLTAALYDIIFGALLIVVALPGPIPDWVIVIWAILYAIKLLAAIYLALFVTGRIDERPMRDLLDRIAHPPIPWRR